MRTSPLALAFAFAPLAFAAPVLPCSPPLPSLDGTAVPDAGGVLPVNGLVHARMFAGGTVGASLRADAEVGERRLDVDNIAGVTRINLEGLAPSTSYTLTLSMPAGAGIAEGEGEDFTENRARAIHFTTTRAVDTTPPAFEGAADVVVIVTHVPAENFVDSCGFGGEADNKIDIVAPRVHEDVGVAGLKLMRVNDDGTRELRHFRLHSGGDGDDEATLSDSEPTPGDYAYEIVAVDLAGNESAPLPVDVTVPSALGCSAGGGVAAPFAFALLLLVRTRRARMRS